MCFCFLRCPYIVISVISIVLGYLISEPFPNTQHYVLYKCWRYHSIFSGSTGYQMLLKSPSVGTWEQRTYVWIGILNCLNIILVARIHNDCRCCRCVFVCTVCSLYMNGLWMYPQWLLVCVLPPYASMGKQRKVHASPRFLEGQSKTPRKDASRYVQKKHLHTVFRIYRLKNPAPIWIVWVIYLLQMVTHQHACTPWERDEYRARKGVSSRDRDESLV